MIKPRLPAINPAFASAMSAARGVFCSMIEHHFSSR